MKNSCGFLKVCMYIKNKRREIMSRKMTDKNIEKEWDDIQIKINKFYTTLDNADYADDNAEATAAHIIDKLQIIEKVINL